MILDCLGLQCLMTPDLPKFSDKSKTVMFAGAISDRADVQRNKEETYMKLGEDRRMSG
jgi:hypothetical protein